MVVKLYSILTGNEWEGMDGTIAPYILAVLAMLFFNTVILVVQNLFILQYRNAQVEIEKLQLETNVTNAKNLLLRQQIQPHFLFNALTTIKALYKQDQKLGEEYLVHLADFLRVSISNPKQYKALIGQEVSYCQNYLKMQKIRFGSALEYDIVIDQHVMDTGGLPYLSLQSVVENVLKHNGATEEKPLRIEIYKDNDYIVVKNNLQKRVHKELSLGNGLYNLNERYRLLGEDNVKITSDNLFFTVYLKILY